MVIKRSRATVLEPARSTDTFFSECPWQQKDISVQKKGEYLFGNRSTSTELGDPEQYFAEKIMSRSNT
ncbi:hypothetical protein EAF00_011907 [Botryotinia globosa]|nr:hypothetical protein EAF00_011907 [Botryotinia globosa]